MNLLSLSSKQLAKIPLFWNVKQINGEKSFKILCDNAKVIHQSINTQSQQFSLQNLFIYIKEGQVLIYKLQSDKSRNRSLIRAYKTGDYCGIQDYPLFWGQKIEIQVKVKTTLVTIPISYFYRIFRRVIPMTYLQSKTEYFKKLSLFKSIQLEKIFKIACLSHKVRVQQGQIIAKQKTQINSLIIIYSGKFELESQFLQQPIICSQNEILFQKQIKQGINCCFFKIKCLLQGDLILVPKQQYIKVIDLRYKIFHETVQKEDDADFQSDKNRYIQTSYKQNRTAKNFHRPKTQSKEYSQSNFNNTSYSGFSKTRNNTKQVENLDNREQYKKRAASSSEVQYRKYLQRKYKIETNNYLRHIESRAPEIVINPSKQFAVCKPFYKSKSLYIKNMKRKMKKSANYTEKLQIKSHTTSKYYPQ